MDRPGFGAGLLTGIGLGLGLVLALALAFPPFVLAPPVLDAETAIAPPAPDVPTPGGAGEPRVPEPLVTLPSGAPIVPARPAPPPIEAMRGIAPRAAPDVFSGATTGSPSLVPQPAD